MVWQSEYPHKTPYQVIPVEIPEQCSGIRFALTPPDASPLSFCKFPLTAMSDESEAVLSVAKLMVLASRTAPKAKGVDTIVTRVLRGPALKRLSLAMATYGKEHEIGFFLRDAQNVAKSSACVIVGARGNETAGLNCGACGYATCADLIRVFHKEKTGHAAFTGPNCAIRMTDLGIAVGSAAKTASIHNTDNRIMFSAGVAALSRGIPSNDCTVAYGIPLSATGKNIFFDRS
jgi:uncharacterized ferredoxin-like protein